MRARNNIVVGGGAGGASRSSRTGDAKQAKGAKEANGAKQTNGVDAAHDVEHGGDAGEIGAGGEQREAQLRNLNGISEIAPTGLFYTEPDAKERIAEWNTKGWK